MKDCGRPNCIPCTYRRNHEHYRLIDDNGRVRSYADSPEDFGPIPKGWTIKKVQQS